MNGIEFWNLIDLARRSASNQPKWLVDHLGEMPVEQIVEFGRLLRAASIAAYDERLWAAAHAINGGCSDDSFSDFRNWLIAQGKQLYDRALADPDSLADVGLPTSEEIFSLGFSVGAAAYQAYKAKTGLKDFSQKMGILPPSAWQLKNKGIWESNNESLKRVVPRLYAKYAFRA